MTAAVRRDVVDAVAAKARLMSRRGCGSAHSLAVAKVEWYLSTGTITPAEADAVLAEIPAHADYYGVLQNATEVAR